MEYPSILAMTNSIHVPTDMVTTFLSRWDREGHHQPNHDSTLVDRDEWQLTVDQGSGAITAIYDAADGFNQHRLITLCTALATVVMPDSWLGYRIDADGPTSFRYHFLADGWHRDEGETSYPCPFAHEDAPVLSVNVARSSFRLWLTTYSDPSLPALAAAECWLAKQLGLPNVEIEFGPQHNQILLRGDPLLTATGPGWLREMRGLTVGDVYAEH